MGVLADFHVLEEADIARLQRGEHLRAPLDLKGILPDAVAALAEALTGASLDETFDTAEFRDCEGGSEATIMLLPADLVSALAAIPPAKVRGVAKRWAAIEEMNASTGELEPILDRLIELAKTAKPPRRMLLWNSP